MPFLSPNFRGHEVNPSKDQVSPSHKGDEFKHLELYESFIHNKNTNISQKDISEKKTVAKIKHQKYPSISSCWFQLIWKIWVKLEIFPQFSGWQ